MITISINVSVVVNVETGERRRERVARENAWIDRVIAGKPPLALPAPEKRNARHRKAENVRADR